MSRSRGYTLYVENYSNHCWNLISKLKNSPSVDFLCACIGDDREITGYVRFVQAKTQTAAEAIFNNEITVFPVSHGDKHYRNELSKGINYFEYDSKIPIQAVVAPPQPTNNIDAIELAKVIVDGLSNNQSMFVDKITEVCKTVVLNHAHNTNNNNSHNTNNTNNNTTNNNTTNNHNRFNLQFFLNERCKDALNMSEFAKTLPIGLDDILYFKNHSHADSITRIIENALNGMDMTKWPIHCTDLKRETLHVREDDKWINDVTKKVTGKAIETVASRSFKGISMWKDANPGHSESEDLKNDYAKMVKSLLGGNLREEENKDKIIRNMSRITHLERDKILM